jgi:hypothetical protein
MKGMSGRRLFPRDNILMWLSACLLVLGLASFVANLTANGGAEAASWAQPVMVDGEEVDPSEDAAEDAADPISSDHHVVDRLVFTGLRVGLHIQPAVAQGFSCHVAFFDLASRPPPVL